MTVPDSLWGRPDAALEAMRNRTWDRDEELAALQSALQLDASRPAGPGGRVRPMPDVDTARGLGGVTHGGREMRVRLAMSAPRLLLVDGVLDDEECDALIRIATPRLERSRTLGRRAADAVARGSPHGSSVHEVSEWRTSHEAFLDGIGLNPYERACHDHVEDRLHALFGWPRGASEPLQVVRYRPGEEFRPHHDWLADDTPQARAGRQRVATVVCYLNEPRLGGFTRFPDVALEVVPRRGSALFFSYEAPTPGSRTLHAGLPVLEGSKWIATKWFTRT